MLSYKVLEAFEHIKLDPPHAASMTRETPDEHLSLHTALQGLRPIIETASEKTGVPFQALLSALYTEDVEAKNIEGGSEDA